MAKLNWRIIFLTVAVGVALLEMSLLGFVHPTLVPIFFFLDGGRFFWAGCLAAGIRFSCTFGRIIFRCAGLSLVLARTVTAPDVVFDIYSHCPLAFVSRADSGFTDFSSASSYYGELAIIYFVDRSSWANWVTAQPLKPCLF